MATSCCSHMHVLTMHEHEQCSAAQCSAAQWHCAVQQDIKRYDVHSMSGKATEKWQCKDSQTVVAGAVVARCMANHGNIGL
jgi:hypothetical protein